MHKGYNELVTTTSIGEQWKYQGQERTFDLGLNKSSEEHLERFLNSMTMKNYKSEKEFQDNFIKDYIKHAFDTGATSFKDFTKTVSVKNMRLRNVKIRSGYSFGMLIED